MLNNTFGKTHCELQKNDESKKDFRSWTYCKILLFEGICCKTIIGGLPKIVFHNFRLTHPLHHTLQTLAS